MTPETEPAPAVHKVPAGEGMMGLAGFLVFVGWVLGVVGVAMLFSEPRVVGGDAYNFQIGATRGVGFLCAGVLVIGTSIVAALAAIRARSP